MRKRSQNTKGEAKGGGTEDKNTKSEVIFEKKIEKKSKTSPRRQGK